MNCPPEFQELLKTLYGLSSQETKVLSYLCDKEARVKEIAEELGKDRSTVQRYLSSLRTANLVSRKSVVNKEGKGRYFVYFVSNKEKLKRRIKSRLKGWEEEKLEVLSKL